MVEKWFIRALSKTALSVFTDIFYQSLLPKLQNDASVLNFVTGCSGFLSIFRGIKESARMSHRNF